MSEGELGVDQENFFWENPPWAFPSSNNSADGEGKKLSGSGLKSPMAVGRDPGEGTGEKRRRSSLKKKKTKKSTGKGICEMGNEEKAGDGGGGSGDESDHEMHIWTERERRKKMRDMFSSLHALLPQLPPKADKSTIVDEAVNCIKTLEHTLQTLQKQRLERLKEATKPVIHSRESFLAEHGSSSNPHCGISDTLTSPNSLLPFPPTFQTWTSPNVILNICGGHAQFNVCAVKKPGLFTAICYVLEKYKLEVVSAHVSCDHHRSMYMIQAQAGGAIDRLMEPFPVEEIYKQAAAEIMLWVSS